MIYSEDGSLYVCILKFIKIFQVHFYHSHNIYICFFFPAWGFGILSVTIISLASLLGAFVVPFMNKAFYRKLLLFMVSLAVGVLGGSGLFHLLPHVSGLVSNEN